MKFFTADRWMARAALLTIVAFVVISGSTVAHADDCGRDDDYAAETVTAYLDSWKNVYMFYKQFKRCDDGGVAEGVSEAVARLMADHWTSLPEVLRLTRTDPAFATWFIDHLDETDNRDDLIKIDRLAQTECPAGAQEFCQKIHIHLVRPVTTRP